jgi:hypothetical protein
VKHVVIEPTLVHGDGELYGKGELHEGELDGEREVREEGGLHEERELHHGVEEVQDPEGGLNGKGELLHGQRLREVETEIPSVICRILRDRLEGHVVVSVQLLLKAEFPNRG